MKVPECLKHYSFIFQMLKGSYLSSWWWDLAEIQTHLMMKIHSKMKALECSQHFSDNKSMEIFSNVHRRVTP